MKEKLEKTEACGQEQFAEFAGKQVNRILEMLRSKGRQYSPGDLSATANFDDGCSMVGLSPEHYLMVLANKQWYVLCQWAAGKRPDMSMDEVRERAGDVVIYLLLLLWMCRED